MPFVSSEIEGRGDPLKREIQQYLDLLHADFDTGFRALLKLDSFSTRQYLTTQIATSVFLLLIVPSMLILHAVWRTTLRPLSQAQIQELETYASYVMTPLQYSIG